MSKRALLLIDVQQGLDDPYYGVRNNPAAERNMARLLGAWREWHAPETVIHVQHSSVNPKSPLYPGKPGWERKQEAAAREGELVLTKNVNSCFIGTPLEKTLRERGITDLVVCGLTTDHCVSTTVRMAANLGFNVVLVGDACAAHGRTGPDGRHYSADEIHNGELASLHGEFAQVTTTSDLLQKVNSAAV